MTSSATSAAPVRYTNLVITLHWLMALLILGAYVTIELREYYPRGSVTRESLKTFHYMIGLSVLVLLAVRVYARFSSHFPPIIPHPAAWQALAARGVHLALLALMLVLPISGWIILSAEADPIPFWGLELPPLVAPDALFADSVEEVHETIGELGYYLIGLHTVAALFHHYFVKDNTLSRMLPGRRG